MTEALHSGRARLCSEDVLSTSEEKTGERVFLLVLSEEKQKLRSSTYLPEVLKMQQRTSGLSWGSAAVRKALPTVLVQVVNWESKTSTSTRW